MKSEDIKKQLTPGIIVGLILGFGLSMIAGVNPTDPVPNYIGVALACLIPTLLNGIIVLKGTAKTLNRDLSIIKAFVKIAPSALGAGIFGYCFAAILLEMIMHFDTCSFPLIFAAVYQALLGVVVSTLTAYYSMKSYENSVKYTRRSSSEKK